MLKIGIYKPETDTEDEVIEREYFRQGFIYKDEEAYKNSFDKVCYIPELSDNVYTHQNFLDMCDDQEELASELFGAVDWQHPETLIEDWYVNGEWDTCQECNRMFSCYGETECPHCHAKYESE